MKLIIKQYLASLKERDELDVILPDLLSEMGLTVFSRPSRGTRQDGVDVAAVGSLNGGEEKVYLFSIKAGNLTRQTWDGDALQSLRPSLNEILDSYIPARLPEAHHTKKIVICLCFGGDINENIRASVEGFIKTEKSRKDNIDFEEWNGDRLASLILEKFLQEDLLPEELRSHLRKSLALLDEPNASYRHFSELLQKLTNVEYKSDKHRLTVVRQITICLWILFAWARDADNLEAAYLTSELALLHTWDITKQYQTKQTKLAKEVKESFYATISTYWQISSAFINTKILPFVAIQHGLSTSIHSSCSLDINLKLFDILGRLSLEGIWAYYLMTGFVNGEEEVLESLKKRFLDISEAIKHLIINNSTLFLPIKDEQAVDISIAVLLLMTDVNNHQYIEDWLSKTIDRINLSYHTHKKYPCTLRSYSDLLDHPRYRNDEYRREVTGGSTLLPIIALVAALLDKEEIYRQVQSIKHEILPHCNFQLWYPDEKSEEHIYTNTDIHGGALCNVNIDGSMENLLKQVFDECEHSPQFQQLSAVEQGLWPLILIACRHYQLPVPVHFWQEFNPSRNIEEKSANGDQIHPCQP